MNTQELEYLIGLIDIMLIDDKGLDCDWGNLCTRCPGRSVHMANQLTVTKMLPKCTWQSAPHVGPLHGPDIVAKAP